MNTYIGRIIHKMVKFETGELNKFGLRLSHRYFYFASLLPTRFPSAGLSVDHFHSDRHLNWSLGAMRARLLITQLTASYPTR